MRVIVTGISGINKMQYLEKVMHISNSEIEDLETTIHLDPEIHKKAKIDKIVSLDEIMCRQQGFKSPHYLDKIKRDIEQFRNVALNDIIKRTKGFDNVVLEIHAVIRRSRSVFHPLDWNMLRNFHPDMFICLIDDVHHIQKEIRNRAQKIPDESEYLSLKDILAWREEEIMQTEILANNLIPNKRIPHYVLSIRHPPEILYQLMFESNDVVGSKGKDKVYASFPITSTETESDITNEEIEEFKSKLSKHFIVFNPITIGEKILHQQFKMNIVSNNPKDFIEIEGGAYRLNVLELFPIINDINKQIISRDERLIEQSNMVIAYRPGFSIGSKHEIDYARLTGRIPSYAIILPGDPPSPFSTETMTERFSSVEDLIKNLIGGKK